MYIFANCAYCFKNNRIGQFVPDDQVVADVLTDNITGYIFVYFKGAQMTKSQWETRKPTFVPFHVDGMKTNKLILVDSEWFQDANLMKQAVTQLLKKEIEKHRNTPLKIFFVGHGVGGAYAAISAIIWKINLRINHSTATPDDISASENLYIFTFGQPRIGNIPFARMVNRLLKDHVIRVTHENDPAPHFSPSESGKVLTEHFETEVWLKSIPCDCASSERPISIGETNIYECLGFLPNWKNAIFEIEKAKNFYKEGIYDVEGGESGENLDCNAGQSIAGVPDDFVHKGPYFKFFFEDCSGWGIKNANS
ncbi:hypothetical protein G9A89_001825 [Geosiphon pyriformis]|nr:hypothetical protein G9A89_001825 [Geosiphon pyriformis]